MTVCIAAISHWMPDSQALIVASDHMVTMGGFIQYEHDVSKIRFLTPKICVMMAGDTLAATSIIRRLDPLFRDGDYTVLEVAETAQKFYEELRQDQIISQVFRPRGITMEQFYEEGLQTRMQPQMVGSIDNEVMSYDLGVELLVAGIGSDGANIYTIGNPGLITNYNHSGYVSVGSGSIHAIQSLIGFRHSRFHSLFETIFTVYASKRRAEAAPGVGSDTDLVIITPSTDSFVILEQPQLVKLNSLYNKYSQPGSQGLAQEVADLNLFDDEEENAKQAEAPNTEQPDNAPESV